MPTLRLSFQRDPFAHRYMSIGNHEEHANRNRGARQRPPLVSCFLHSRTQTQYTHTHTHRRTGIQCYHATVTSRVCSVHSGSCRLKNTQLRRLPTWFHNSRTLRRLPAAECHGNDTEKRLNILGRLRTKHLRNGRRRTRDGRGTDEELTPKDERRARNGRGTDEELTGTTESTRHRWSGDALTKRWTLRAGLDSSPTTQDTADCHVRPSDRHGSKVHRHAAAAPAPTLVTPAVQLLTPHRQ